MKLTTLVYGLRNRFTNIIRLTRLNPLTSAGRQAIMARLRQQARNQAENINISGFNQQQSPPPQEAQAQPNNGYNAVQTSRQISAPPLIQQHSFVPSSYEGSTYPEYECKTHNPLGCHYPHNTIQQAPQAKFCSGCGFMVPLAENQEIRGRRGIYQITRVGINQGHQLIRSRGMGRLYEGIRKNDNQPIVIKEFVLPQRSFRNLEDVQHRQGTFVSVANLTSADGRDRDFRLLIPWEAIADENERRCYLIASSNLEALPTLKSYLSEQGKMKSEQVKNLLDQILQTLEFIHGQRFLMSSGQIQQALVHGNLSLDSALIYTHEHSFFIYLTDLLIWEYLFYHPDTIIAPKTVADDLKATGEIGLAMLAGQQLLDPRNEQSWPEIETNFQQFLLRLLELETPFKTATEAREVLRQLPQPKQEEQAPIKVEQDQEKKQKFNWLPWLITPVVLIGFFGIRAIVKSMILSSYPTAETPREICCDLERIEDVNVPAGEFTYTASKLGTSNYILTEPSLLSSRRSLVNELQTIKPELLLEYTVSNNEMAAINRVEKETVNFGVIGQVTPSTPRTIVSKTIAYDALLIIVPFTASQRENSIPQALQGKISFEQVQQLYTGKIENWRELGGPNLQVKLYMPRDPLAVELFETRVLQDESQIAQFRNLSQRGMIEKRETIPTITNFQSELENSDIGGISFGFASKIFNQCGGYPLALIESESWGLKLLKQILFIRAHSGVIPYVNKIDGSGITPNLNLCTSKGNYRLAEEQIQTQVYPLSIPISVIYPLNNKDEPKYQIGPKFAEMLTTYEGQRLLQQTNVVTLPTK